MKKKNLLFVIPSLSAGGGEKSLVNLLSQIDFSQYDVDLFMFNHDGLFMDFIPTEVRVLPLPETYQLFSKNITKAVKELLMKGKLSLAYNRVIFTLKNKYTKNVSTREQYTWRHLAKSFARLEKNYDVAIGFLEKTSTYFCVDKVNAAKKIGWVHIDYDKLGMDPKFDIGYFQKLNKIVTVSEECENIFKNRFPSEKNKVEIVYNIVSPTMIYKMAAQESQDVYKRKNNEIIILSIGRLHFQKGFELAIEACKKLVDKGYNIKWNIVGEGEERKKLESLIKLNKLEDHFKLLGLKANPYPYIKQADIYAQTSKFEGKSIAIDEAKILNKPIIVTNYSTAKDQITNGMDGLVAEMNSNSVAEHIENLIQDEVLRKKLINNLSQLKLGTEGEINKLYGIFSG
ncbi:MULTISPECIES: glycosyltransferase [unclassified Bacillus (in: firmicutes)]|uniref:glycosyltransferase n=1 Tax=unclassified Bacillus (in: firmicutes) TaxID=185979 RepID=UPI0020365D3C|nr:MULTISPECIES: glycosyltransferase [unclassified Bacillus (in: firmicutes)]